MLALSGLAWLALAVLAAQGHHSHDVAGQVALWSLMAVAMMPPLTVASIRVVAARSMWPRRNRAIAAFLLGFLGLWLVAGVTVSAVSALGNRAAAPPQLTSAAAFLVAAIWQLTGYKVRALRACHKTMPLAPRGLHADADCLRFGWLIGQSCFVSCWAMMLACIVAGHGLQAMACCSFVGISERWSFRPNQHLQAALLSGIAILYATAIL